MKELIQRIKDDDLSAVAELYEMVKSTGMKVAVSYVGQEGLEEDMFHEAFIKALENLDKFDVERSFQSWFDVILANTCKSHLRKKKPANLTDVTSDKSEEESYFGEISDIGNPEECWDQKELQLIMKDMIDGLSKEQKEAIILFYYRNMSVASIAEFQKCSEETVKSRLYQGRNKLKAAVEEYEKKANIKLHSIAIIPALYVFFKSGMGDAYACQFMEEMVADAAAEAGKALVQDAAEETAKEAVKEAAQETAKEVMKETAKEATKEAVTEVAKSAAMKLSTKILVGIVAVAIVGGSVALVSSLNKEEQASQSIALEDSVERSDEVVIQPSEEVILESSEEIVESSEEVMVEVTEAPEATESPNADKPIAEGITVHPIENGVRKLTADNNIIGFTAANGGVIITNTEEGCGAIDY